MNDYEARAKALELIITNAPGGQTWVNLVRQASILADFIIDGTVSEDVEK